MFLDDIDLLRQVDADDYLALLQKLPSRLEHAWYYVHSDSHFEFQPFERIVIIAPVPVLKIAELFIDPLRGFFKSPVFLVSQDEWIDRKEDAATLAVVISLFENEIYEHISEIHQINNLQVLLISNKFKNSAIVSNTNIKNWQIFIDEEMTEEYRREPVAISSALFFAIMEKTSILPDSEKLFTELIQISRNLNATLDFSVPMIQNPAKRLAGQLFDRVVVISSTSSFETVSGFWKWQINRLAKTFAFTETVLIDDVAPWNAIGYPESIVSKLFFLFLKSSQMSRNSEKTLDEFHSHLLSSGIGTDEIYARGDTSLAQNWNLALFGYFCAYYLAIANQVDPGIDLRPIN